MEKINIDGLIGIPYCQPEKMRDPLKGCDCWMFARLVMARACVALPADPAEALAGESSLGEVVTDVARAGDLVVLRDGADQHVGVMVDRFSFAQMTRSGSSTVSLAAAERRGLVIRRVRAKERAA